MGTPFQARRIKIGTQPRACSWSTISFCVKYGYDLICLRKPRDRSRRMHLWSCPQRSYRRSARAGVSSLKRLCVEWICFWDLEIGGRMERYAGNGISNPCEVRDMGGYIRICCMRWGQQGFLIQGKSVFRKSMLVNSSFLGYNIFRANIVARLNSCQA